MFRPNILKEQDPQLEALLFFAQGKTQRTWNLGSPNSGRCRSFLTIRVPVP